MTQSHKAIKKSLYVFEKAILDQSLWGKWDMTRDDSGLFYVSKETQAVFSGFSLGATCVLNGVFEMEMNK